MFTHIYIRKHMLILYIYTQTQTYVSMQLFFSGEHTRIKKFVRLKMPFSYNNSFRNHYFQPLTCSDSKKHWKCANAFQAGI